MAELRKETTSFLLRYSVRTSTCSSEGPKLAKAPISSLLSPASMTSSVRISVTFSDCL